VSELYLAFCAVGAAVLLLALFSRPVEKSLLSAPMFMVGLGVILGPAATGLLDPSKWGDANRILEEAARLTLAIALMGIALRLPPGFFRRRWRSLLVLLGAGMPLMWLASSLLSYWLLEIPILLALLIGAIVSPTDPVVASSIVTGKVAEQNLPERLRHLLSAESGSNDGLAYPLVLLPILLMTRPEATVWSAWLTGSVLKQVGGAIVLGIVIGLASGYGFRKAEAFHAMEKTSFLAYTLALSLLALGLGKLLHVEGILAVFVAGLAFDYMVSDKDRAQEENVQEAVNNFFTLPVFGLFGLMLPWGQWAELGWRGIAMCVAILLLRRIPAVLALRRGIPLLTAARDAWFVGWFGPIGVAALLYATLAVHRTGEELAWTVGSLVVFASILAHGATAAPFAFGYRRSAKDSKGD